MSYTLRLTTPEARDLVVEALRASAEQRTRVARHASRAIATAKATGTDVRSRSVKVTSILAEAGDLDALAEELAAATYDTGIAILTPEASAKADAAIADALAAAAPTGSGLVDDGTSPAAQAIADLAGLTPHDPDAVEDPLTGALPEDEPTNPEEVLA